MNKKTNTETKTTETKTTEIAAPIIPVSRIKAEHFKSEALTESTERIAAAYDRGEAAYKDICSELWKVEERKLYETDGFKSLREYAERIGIDKSLAHKMADAGKLLCSTNQAVAELASAMDYSKVAMLASVDASELEAAIKAGEVKPDMTSKEVTEWKKLKTKGIKVCKNRRYVIQTFTAFSNDTLSAMTEKYGNDCEEAFLSMLPESPMGEANERVRALGYAESKVYNSVPENSIPELQNIPTAKCRVGDFTHYFGIDIETNRIYHWTVSEPVKAKPMSKADALRKALKAQGLDEAAIEAVVAAIA